MDKLDNNINNNDIEKEDIIDEELNDNDTSIEIDTKEDIIEEIEEYKSIISESADPNYDNTSSYYVDSKTPINTEKLWLNEDANTNHHTLELNEEIIEPTNNIELKPAKPKSKIFLKVMISFLILLIVSYTIGAFYFKQNINADLKFHNESIDVKTSKELQDFFTNKLNEKISIEIPNIDTKYELDFKDIEAEYQNKLIDKALNKSYNFLMWPYYLINKPSVNLEPELKYNSSLLEKKLDSLKIYDNTGRVASLDAKIVIGENGFEIAPDELGSMIDKDKSLTLIKDEVSKGKNIISLKASLLPAATSKDSLNEYLKQLNTFTDNKITFTNEAGEYVLSKKQLASLFVIDQAAKTIVATEDSVAIGLKKVNEDYAKEQGGIPQIEVNFGYGKAEVVGNNKKVNIFDYDLIIADLKLAIEAKTPQSFTVGLTNNYENFIYINADAGIRIEAKYYVEVSIPYQTLWLYDGSDIILSAAVVTGNEVAGTPTVRGQFSVNYKQADTRLVGNTVGFTGDDDYDLPVKYWIPFFGGYGFHDGQAWRSYDSFGGSTYYAAGSHGCVNMRDADAGVLFSKVESGTPVWVHD